MIKEKIEKEKLIDKNLLQFEELMEEISKLPGEKRKTVFAYVQGMIAGMDREKLN